MADTYTVKSARNAGEKDNPHGGKLVKWYLKLEGSEAGDEDVYCQKKPGFDVTPGLEIYGRLEKGEYGWRLFPEQNPNGSQGRSQNGSGDTRDTAWFDAKDKRISRAGILQAVVAGGAAGVPSTDPDYVLRVNEITDALLASLDERTPHPNDVGSGSSDLPEIRQRSDLSADQPAAASSANGFTSDRQRNYAERLIEQAGASSETRDNIVWFMDEALPRQQVSEAMDGLVDGDQRRATALNLKEQADAWRRTQTDVPADIAGLEGDTPLEDIPF